MTKEKMQMSVQPEQRGGLAVSVSRRRFLAGSGAVGAVAILAACGGDDELDAGPADNDTSTTERDAAPASGDTAIARTAAGLEVLAVNTYRQAGEAAGAGQLGTVPPAVAEYVKVAMAHHQEHLDAWNKVITGAGGAAVTQPDAKLKPTIDAEFAKAKDVAAVAQLALMLERVAADTYLKAVPMLDGDSAIELAGSIQAVDRQHQSVLLFALGQYPVPDTFQSTAKAAF